MFSVFVDRSVAAFRPALASFADRAQTGLGRLIALWLGVAVLSLCAMMVHAKGVVRTDTLPTIALAELPKQGQETHALVLQGGPFPYDKDGTVFGNRERLLPLQARGFYREYTVKTPFKRNRGERRIVCGGKQPAAPEVCYYTADHYASFARIVTK
jgi:ribonuclease T1